jgi:predicted SnoaL-like aldol condensation-catalyzing enzyme
MDKILSHYTEDFEMSSPYIVSIMNEPGGTLQGKDKIHRYWSIALTRFPDLEFKLIDTFHSVDSIIIYYHSIHRGADAAEYFLFNTEGKVIKSAGHYN